MATRVYIDGFNFYHGAVRVNRFHWLNLEEFARRLNSGHLAERVLYCTAMVGGTTDDPLKAQRQIAYLQALRAACPSVEVVLGKFTSNRKYRRVVGCLKSPACVVEVIERNEKGSDVNLATRLVHDAHLGRFDRAIVVSGDSDLVEPIRIVATEIGREVWVVNPNSRNSRELAAVASDYRHVGTAILRESQFPDPLKIAGKTYHKPSHWSQPHQPKSRIENHKSKCPEQGCGNEITLCRYQ